MDKNQFSLHCLQQPLAVSAKSLHETKATTLRPPRFQEPKLTDGAIAYELTQQNQASPEVTIHSKASVTAHLISHRHSTLLELSHLGGA